MESSSRLIVKGLPSRITEKRLRDLFSSHGTVTDCQPKYRPDGIFRKFAFIGFANDSEAASAKEYYHNTFVDTSRIHVEFCRKIGEAPEKLKKVPDNNESSSKNASKSLVIEISGFAAGTKKKSLLQFFEPLKPKRFRLSRNDKDGGECALVFLAKHSEVQALLKKNGKFFGGCKLTVKSVSANDERIRTMRLDNSKNTNVGHSTSQTADECVEKISETGRLFVRNLPYVCTVEEIDQLFKSYGPLADVKVPMVRAFGGKSDDGAKKPKGIALVTFVFPEHALKAFSELDGTVYKGRMLHIIAGEEKADDKDAQSSSTLAGASFKSKKIAQLKSSSSQSHNWNSLFLSPNAVADVLTDRLDTEKSNLLDAERNPGSLGVRMALGETYLVRETKEFLLNHGVRLDSFGRPDAARSKTVILVKNLPAKTTAEELKANFDKFGTIARVVLPPSGISALVEFLDEQEAKNAFSSLAYVRFKTVPLYLEWAPGDVFANGENDEAEKPVEEKEADTETITNRDEPLVEEDGVGTTLFVKNVNFETTDESLREHFSKIGPVVYASVAKKRAASGLLSMGFGFVRFFKKEDAKRCLKEFQGRELDGFALQLKLSERQLASDVEKSRKRRLSPSSKDKSKSDTKILVRNIPFQANQWEVESLFKTFGDIRFARLPKKTGSDGHHRGFGFVDFVSKSDAKKAFDALCHSTHLYGRRLVLEWATTADDTVEELQTKIAAQVALASGRRKHTKKHKIALEDKEQE